MLQLGKLVSNLSYGARPRLADVNSLSEERVVYKVRNPCAMKMTLFLKLKCSVLKDAIKIH